MKRLVAIVLFAAAAAGCGRDAPETPGTGGTPVEVGSKTDLYEVVAQDRLKLAPGAKWEVTPGPSGQGNGIIIFRQNSTPGGFVSCGCLGATSGSCTASSDNPENNPVCIGGCTDSEGTPRPCQMESWTGPPRDPPSFWARKNAGDVTEPLEPAE
jgi:hypothetical protein